MTNIEQIKYYLSQSEISDNGIDALASLLNSADIKETVNQLTEIEVTNLGHFLGYTFLTFRLIGSVLYALLNEARVVSAIDISKQPLVEDRRDTMVGISYYCSTTIISDNGVDALAIILNTKDISSILPLMTYNELMALVSHICNTFLCDRITDATIIVILNNAMLSSRIRVDNETVYNKILKRTKTIPRIRYLLSTNSLTDASAKELSSLLNDDDAAVILELLDTAENENLGYLIENNSANLNNLLRHTTINAVLSNSTVSGQITLESSEQLESRSLLLEEVSSILTTETTPDTVARFAEIIQTTGASSITPVLNSEELQGLTTQLDTPAFTSSFDNAQSVEMLTDPILFDSASSNAVYNLTKNLNYSGFMNLINTVTNLTQKLFGANLMEFLLKFNMVSSAFGAVLSNTDIKNMLDNTKLAELFTVASAPNQVPFEAFSARETVTFDKLFTQVTDEATGLFSEYVGFIEKSASAVKSLVSGDVAGLIDMGFGHSNAKGATHNTGSFLQYGSTPALPELPESNTGETYKKLMDTLNKTLNQNWKTQNSEPGNPLIIEAYKISGRDYKKDGQTGEYIWNTAFVNWVLYKSGLDYLKVMSPSAYASYGSPVNFGTFKNVRKGDIIVFSSGFGLGMVGFVWGYDKKSNMVSVLAGCLLGTLKISKFTLSRTNPEFYVTHVKRNWSIPADLDKPLFEVSMPTRPGQQTSGPQLPTRPGQQTSGAPTPRINYNDNNAGSWGGSTFV